VIIPARNEAGNIPELIRRTPEMGKWTELIFVEGHSKIRHFNDKKMYGSITWFKNFIIPPKGNGKGDAVRYGFEQASGDIFMILDADLSVSPEDLYDFYHAIVENKGEFINGVRLVYPREKYSMRFINLIGNKIFSTCFSWLLGQHIKDTLCGTKVLWKEDYQRIKENRNYFVISILLVI